MCVWLFDFGVNCPFKVFFPLLLLTGAETLITVQMLNRSINSKHKFRSNYSAAEDKCGPEKLQLNV